MTPRDWDYFHRNLGFPGDYPLTPEVAGNQWGMQISDSDYKSLLLNAPGGIMVGDEVHYYGPNSPAANAMRGLGRFTSVRSWDVR
jgi:hypothetical protein